MGRSARGTRAGLSRARAGSRPRTGSCACDTRPGRRAARAAARRGSPGPAARSRPAGPLSAAAQLEVLEVQEEILAKAAQLAGQQVPLPEHHAAANKGHTALGRELPGVHFPLADEPEAEDRAEAEVGAGTEDGPGTVMVQHPTGDARLRVGGEVV